MNEHDKKHLKRLEAIARMVERIYDAAAEDAAAIGAVAVRLGADGEEPFSFDKYPQTKRRMEELLSWLREQLEIVVGSGVAGEWLLSEDKNDELVRRVLGIEDDGDGATVAYGEGKRDKLPEAVRRRLFDRNEKGCEAFLKRKERGLGLSERVWRATESVPSEMAMGIDMGIRDGKPAAAMARDLKQYLKHPDKLFRRVRDERGILHLSKNAAAFHPGRGVYRSSYQNARRLAVTEVNTAYRTADHERWQQLDFVVGVEVHLSGNHTCKGRDGKPHKFEDICDQLAGKYPKTFKFTGWHPHCRCHATSILKTDEEMEADTQRILSGEPVTGESVNEVKDVPEGFKKWVEENEGRIAEAKKRGTLPGWLRENEGMIKAFIDKVQHYSISDLSIPLKPTEMEDISQVNESMTLFAKKHPEYFPKGFKGVKAVSRDRAYMSTDAEGLIEVNFAVDEKGFNAGNSLVSAMQKIQSGAVLDCDEEYSIEALWHEVLHNTSKNKTVLAPMYDPMLGFQRVAMETTNQFVARFTYNVFMKHLGGIAQHQKWVVENGYGYAATVTNLIKLLKKAGIGTNSFLNEALPLLLDDYANFDYKIISVLKKMYKGKGEIGWIFRRIEIENFEEQFIIYGMS